MKFFAGFAFALLFTAPAIGQETKRALCPEIIPKVLELCEWQGNECVLAHEQGYTHIERAVADGTESIVIGGSFKKTLKDVGADGIVDGWKWFSDEQATYEKECERLAPLLEPTSSVAKAPQQ